MGLLSLDYSILMATVMATLWGYHNIQENFLWIFIHSPWLHASKHLLVFSLWQCIKCCHNSAAEIFPAKHSAIDISIGNGIHIHFTIHITEACIHSGASTDSRKSRKGNLVFPPLSSQWTGSQCNLVDISSTFPLCLCTQWKLQHYTTDITNNHIVHFILWTCGMVFYWQCFMW